MPRIPYASIPPPTPLLQHKYRLSLVDKAISTAIDVKDFTVECVVVSTQYIFGLIIAGGTFYSICILFFFMCGDEIRGMKLYKKECKECKEC
jgi:hypothetical protein